MGRGARSGGVEDGGIGKRSHGNLTRLGHEGKVDEEGGAAVGSGLVGQGSAMGFDDARADGESESRAAGLGREEGIEQAALDFGWDSRSPIADGEGHDGHDFALDAQGSPGGAEGDCIPGFAGIHGVPQEVQQDLAELAGIRGESRVVGGGNLDPELASFEVGSEQGGEFAEGGSGLDEGRARGRGFGEAEEVVDDPFEAGDLGADDDGVAVFVAVVPEQAGEREGAGLDAGEGIADFVGNTGGKHAEGGQLLALFKGEARLLEAGAERGDQVAPDEESEAGHQAEEGGEGTEGEVVEGGDGFLGCGERPVDLVAVDVIEFVGQGEEGSGILFQLVDELGGLDAGAAAGPGGEEAVGVGLEGGEGGLDAVEDGGVGEGGGIGGLGLEPAAECVAGGGETFAFVLDAGHAIAGEGVVHFEDLCLVMLGEFLAGFEGGCQVCQATGFAPGDPCAPPQRRRHHEDRSGKQRHTARKIKVHVGTMSKVRQVATMRACSDGTPCEMVDPDCASLRR